MPWATFNLKRMPNDNLVPTDLYDWSNTLLHEGDVVAYKKNHYTVVNHYASRKYVLCDLNGAIVHPNWKRTVYQGHIVTHTHLIYQTAN